MYIHTPQQPRAGARPGRPARAHVRYMYVHICMHMYICVYCILILEALRRQFFCLLKKTRSWNFGHVKVSKSVKMVNKSVKMSEQLQK